MRICRELRFVITIVAGLFSTMFLVFTHLINVGLVTVGVQSQANDAAFLSFVFSFMGGMWTMIILDKWDRRG